MRHLCIPVAWKIHKDESVIDVEEINQLGSSGSRAGFNKMFSVYERVDQAGFAHIGTAGKGNFGQVRRRILGGFGSAGDKIGGFYMHGNGNIYLILSLI
jgi:hypothetical protein